MRKFLVFLFLFIFSFSAHASEKDVISGIVKFKCDFKGSFLESHGFKYYEKVSNGSSVTNVFGAKDAKIIIRNSDNKVIGIGTSDDKGHFSITVDEDEIYQIEARFLSLKKDEVISKSDANDFSFVLDRLHTTELSSLLK